LKNNQDAQIQNLELNMEDFIKEFLTCPLTGKIFNNPIITIKNEIYEYQAYIDKYNNNDDILFEVLNLKSFIHSLLETYPQIKERQYVIDASDNEIKSHNNKNNSLLNSHINKGKYDIILQFKEFKLQFIDQKSVIKLFKNAQDIILKYFIDNVHDLSQLLYKSQWHLINYLTRDIPLKPHILQYLIEKGNMMKLNCTDDGWYPLHQIPYYSKNNELIIFAINKHIEEQLDLFIPDNSGNPAISVILSYASAPCITHALSFIDNNIGIYDTYIEKFIKYIKNNNKLSKDDVIYLTDLIAN